MFKFFIFCLMIYSGFSFGGKADAVKGVLAVVARVATNHVSHLPESDVLRRGASRIHAVLSRAFKPISGSPPDAEVGQYLKNVQGTVLWREVADARYQFNVDCVTREYAGVVDLHVRKARQELDDSFDTLMRLSS